MSYNHKITFKQNSTPNNNNIKFTIPTSSIFIRWEAEQAIRFGTWKVIEHPWASGGAYVITCAGDGEKILEFPFEVKEEVTLSFYPEWWRHGEQKPARRFPDPFPRTFGPTVLIACSNKVYYNAPATGRIGIIDAITETLLRPIDVGGYPIDIVCDNTSARVYVVDAAQNRVVVLDANDAHTINEISVPELPWSAVLYDDRLFVACIKGRCISVINTKNNKLESTIKLNAHPYQVMVLPTKPLVLRVKLLPNVFDPVTLNEEIPDRFEFYLPSKRETRTDRDQPAGLKPFEQSKEYKPRRREVEYEFPLRTPEWEPVNKIFDSKKDHTIRVQDISQVEMHVIDPEDPSLKIRNLQGEPGNETRYIDTSSVTKSNASSQLPFPLSDDPGPAALDKYGKVLFFVSPSLGRVGVLDMEREIIIKQLDIGGYITDLAVDKLFGKVYVCDALGNRIIVLDGNQLEVIRTVIVPTMPLSITMTKEALLVACYGDSCIAVIDRYNDKIIQVKPLPAHPIEVNIIRLFPKYTFFNAGQDQAYNYIPPDSEAQERLLVQMAHPLTFDTKTLQPISIDETSIQYEKRNKALAAGKMFLAQTCFICVDGKRWIDLASVVDSNLLPEPSLLRFGDFPGTITIALDDGPEHDWKRNIWMEPDNELYLQNGTDEFWRWNAVRFTVDPGEHILRVYSRSPFACIDAINVALGPPSDISIFILPEPRVIHELIPFSSYHGVFYDSELVHFTICVTNVKSKPIEGILMCEVRNIFDDSFHCDEESISINPNCTNKKALRLELNDWGIFKLSLKFMSYGAELAKEYWFLRLPKLDYPRLLFRRDDITAINERVHKYPRLFRRYSRWLRRHCDDIDFLPATLLTQFYERSNLLIGQLAYMDVLAKWRVLACQFTNNFVEWLDEADHKYIEQKVAPYFVKDYADQTTFVHNWFRAALALLYDMAAANSKQVRDTITDIYDCAWEDLDRIEENLLSLHEPLTPKMRLSLSQQMKWVVNVDRYFTAHGYQEGGNLYASHHSLCVCPIFGTLGTLLLYRNIFGMPRLFERPYFFGWFTHYRYVMPRNDSEGFFAHGSIESGGPITGVKSMDVKTMVDAIAMLTRHPLEKYINQWDAWLTEADTEVQLDDERVDEIFKKGIGVCIPIFLALGWYNPMAPETKWDELPLTQIFEGEGEVVMNSDWSEGATSLYFTCGVRDVTTRHQAGHLQIMKAGKVLLGSPAVRRGDHGAPKPSWGNVVVVGDKWPQWWMRAIGHPRGMDQHIIINRYAPEARIYDEHNEAFLKGTLLGSVRYDNYRGILGFHEHVQNPFIKEGDIVAFETSPQFDYVAGDMTNSWTFENVIEAYRQILFIKPNTVVVYDRFELTEDDKACWLAAVWQELSIDRKHFFVRNKSSLLVGQVLLPEDGLLAKTSTADYGEIIKMPVIEIQNKAISKHVEYLVVMRVSDGINPTLSGLGLTVDGDKVKLLIPDVKAMCVFHRSSEVGGYISITTSGKVDKHDFVVEHKHSVT